MTMCGIFGVIAKKDSNYSYKFTNNILEQIALLSESRGKDSSGIVFREEVNEKFSVLKGAIPVSDLIKSNMFKQRLNGHNHKRKTQNPKLNSSYAAIGHARLVTNGTQLDDVNNQPVIKDGIVGVHNGIIVNVDELWKENSDISRKYDIDTEVMLSLIRKYINQGYATKSAISKTINKIFGTVATAIFFDDINEIALATNNGSLYILTNSKDILIFASERHFLRKLFKKNYKLLNLLPGYSLFQVASNTGYIIKLDDFSIEKFNINGSDKKGQVSCLVNKFKIEEYTNDNNQNQLSAIVDIEKYRASKNFKKEYSFLEYNWESIKNLKRCSKCVLPETFPFIEFDDKGVCNYCNNYKIKNQPKPIEELQALVEPYKSKAGSPDCIVPFSGGRDSTYTLHIVKNILKVNPIAFTYDWGMVTDLARRNIARICGKLGVETIIVSANIRWKRENIRKNIEAWLQYPKLGMIPLFMAGDKFFFYYTNQVKKQTGLKLNIWGINNLENTEFKIGFAGIKPNFDKKRIYSMSIKNHLKLFGFVGKNFIRSPKYFNQSVLDTLGSFASRYIAPKKDYYHLFDYYRWDENEVEELIINEYNWETAIDTKSTWRIGDGTASFYNYIYFTVAGFSEIETFRSNQIREGMITREEALKLIEDENHARYDSLKWYLEIIGLDFETVIKIINGIPKLYNNTL